MSRRYRYSPRWTARQLSEAMFALDLTSGQLARLSGANVNRVQRWLKGEDETPVYVQRDLEIWKRNREAFELAVEWADAHAQDVRDDEG